MSNRQVQVGATKCLFEQLIDRHAEAYIAAYPEVKEFSNFDKSGTINYYIGMVWMDDCEKPPTNQLKIRGSQSLSKNKLLELDLSSLVSQQVFFPGQIVAFSAEPHFKGPLTVRRFLDPMRIAPQMKKINTDAEINLVVACGPFLKAEQNCWMLFDKLIEKIKSSEATHVILIGPFVDFDNQYIYEQYNSSWRTVVDKLVEGLYECECHVYLVPSIKDIIPSELSSTYFYPRPELELKLNLKEGVIPKCSINPVSDPAQIDLGGIYVDVTSADTLFHLNKCVSFVNKGPGNMFYPLFQHIISHGIYPIYPSPLEIAVDYPKLEKYIQLDRLGPHMIVLPTRFSTSLTNVDNRIVLSIHKCTIKKHFMLVRIPRIESSEDVPVDSIAASNYTHQIIDLLPKSLMNTPSKPSQSSLDSSMNTQDEVPVM